MKVAIPNQLVNEGSLINIAVYVAIKSHKNIKTDLCCPSEELISKELNCSIVTVKRAVAYLTDRYFGVEKVNVKGTTKFHNSYSFVKLYKNYVLVDSNIMTLANYEAIGFLVSFKNKCYDNSLRIKATKAELAFLLQMSEGKLRKMLALCKEYIAQDGLLYTLSGAFFTANNEYVLKNRRTRKEVVLALYELAHCNGRVGKEAVYYLLNGFFINTKNPKAIVNAIITNGACRISKEERRTVISNNKVNSLLVF